MVKKAVPQEPGMVHNCFTDCFSHYLLLSSADVVHCFLSPVCRWPQYARKIWLDGLQPVPHSVYSTSCIHKEEEESNTPPLTHTFLTLNGKKQQHSDSTSTLHTTWQIYSTCIYVEHTGSFQKNQKVLSLQQHQFIIVAFSPPNGQSLLYVVYI